jgi:hypothetical protein
MISISSVAKAEQHSGTTSSTAGKHLAYANTVRYFNLTYKLNLISQNGSQLLSFTL